jgi:AcrR family transcriptional regulator
MNGHSPLEKTGPRKEQIIEATIARIARFGFEGLRIRDIAQDVGINNATLHHHFPSKEVLIGEVVAYFGLAFERAIAEPSGRKSDEPIAQHVRTSLTLMRRVPDMFVVLNELMARANRDPEVAKLLVPTHVAWKERIESMLLGHLPDASPAKRERASELAEICIVHLIGVSLLLSSQSALRLGTDWDLDTAISKILPAIQPHIDAWEESARLP